MNSFKLAEETWVDQGKDGETTTKNEEPEMAVLVLLMMTTVTVTFISADLQHTVCDMYSHVSILREQLHRLNANSK